MKILRPIVLLLLMDFGSSAGAVGLESPADGTILTVSGNIDNVNREGKAALDLSALDRLPQHTIKTSTPWFGAPREFSGPLARDLMKFLGAEGDTVIATALNDYHIDIPVQDFYSYDVVIATRIDGKTLSIREKGPVLIIYPFDSVSEIRNEEYFQRCIWQLAKLLVQ